MKAEGGRMNTTAPSSFILQISSFGLCVLCASVVKKPYTGAGTIAAARAAFFFIPTLSSQ